MGNDSHLPKYGEGPKHEIVTDTIPPPRTRRVWPVLKSAQDVEREQWARAVETS